MKAAETAVPYITLHYINLNMKIENCVASQKDFKRRKRNGNTFLTSTH